VDIKNSLAVSNFVSVNHQQNRATFRKTYNAYTTSTCRCSLQQWRELLFFKAEKDRCIHPLLGGALVTSEEFVYDEKNDRYICPNNKILKGNGKIVDDGKGNPVKKYFSLRSDCNKCPLRKNCISDKAKQKKIQRSYYTPLYEAVKERTQGANGRKMRRKRSSTVEPVWGTLMNFMAARRINVRGLTVANKVLMMASACYNLKKWMKFIITKATSNAAVMTKAAEKHWHFF